MASVEKLVLALAATFFQLACNAYMPSAPSCPEFSFPRPLMVFEQQSTMVVVMNHAANVESNSNLFLSLFRANARYTPINIFTLGITYDSMVAYSDGYKNYSRVIHARVPSGLEGSFMLSTSKLDSNGRLSPCSGGHTVLISIVPRGSKTTLGNKKKSAFQPGLDVLFPRDGSTFFSSIDKIEVHVAMQAQSDTEFNVCMIITKVGENREQTSSCWSRNTPQPFGLPVCAGSIKVGHCCNSVGPHALHVWLQDPEHASRQISSQTVIIDMIREPENYRSPKIEILTPRDGESMYESVWLRVQILPYLSNEFNHNYGFRVCALIDEYHEFCGLDPLQPHQLIDVGPGEHNVSVWLEQDNLLSNIVPMISTHSFSVKRKEDVHHSIVPPFIASTKAIYSTMHGIHTQENDLRYFIIVFAFARPLHLSKLWTSLIKSDYRVGPLNLMARVDVKLIIDKPDENSSYSKNHDSVVALAKTLQWPYGTFEIERRSRHYGIRDNVIWSWSPGEDNQHDRVIFLEDDIVVSPFFFQWLLAADAYGKDMHDWAGVSLYKATWNEVLWSPFEERGPLMLQLPCSWGAMYTRSFWENFQEWWKKDKTEPKSLHLPRSLTNSWGSESWKQVALRFLVERNYYLLYPSASFSTTLAPPGFHTGNSKALRRLFHVPIVTSEAEARDAIASLIGKDSQQKLPWYNYLHYKVDPSRESTNASVGNTFAASKVSCSADMDTTTCKMSAVALQGTSFSIFSTSFEGRSASSIQSSIPFIVPTFRHRCCLDNIVEFSIRQVNDKSYHVGSQWCNRHITRHTVLQGASMFPQYGHTLHDFVMSVFAHVQSLKGTQEETNGNSILVLMANKDLQGTDTSSSISLGALDPLIRSLPGIDVETFQPDSDKITCFQSLSIGPSSKLNLYSAAIESAEGQQTLSKFVNFAKKQRTSVEIAKDPKQVNIFLISRGAGTTRQMLNLDMLLSSLQNSRVLASCKASVSSGDFADMSFGDQIRLLHNVHVLVGVLGTGILNSLFLPIDASVVILFPYGTSEHMGWNMRRAAAYTGKRLVLEWSSLDPLSSNYSVSLMSGNGEPLAGATLESARKDFVIRQNPSTLWDQKWLDAFSLYVNVHGVVVNIREVTTLVERGALHSCNN